jgi:hypothetical protein
VWNKLPAAVTQAVLELALKEPQLSPRELAISFVDRQRCARAEFIELNPGVQSAR